jgi:hypothetical protein
MKQDKINKGHKVSGAKMKRNSFFRKKKTLSEDVVEETLEQRLNKVIESSKAISELVVGYTPYTIRFLSQTFAGTTIKPEKISAFEKAIVGIINIDGQTSLSNIGSILGLDIEHDLAERKMIRDAIDSMVRYQLVTGDESAYFITEQGQEFAAHGERMQTFNSEFSLWFFNDDHSFTELRDCVLEEDLQVLKDSEFLSEGEVMAPLSFDEIKTIAEVQASNVQSSKERFILQDANIKSTSYYQYEYLVCFVQSIRTKDVRAIVYDDKQQKVISELSSYVDSKLELKQRLFSSMLQKACESEGFAIYENLDFAKLDPLVNDEDRRNILSAEKKLIEQEDGKPQKNDDVVGSESNPDDLSERLHKRALYDSITFESELHNIFQSDNPDEIWLSSPWVSDGTFMSNRLPLIRNYLKKGGKVFISYSEPDGGLDNYKDSMVGEQSQKALSSLEKDYPKQFFFVELPAFHKKNVIEVKNGQCILFTGSFNVLSFSVTAKNITHVRAEEMCLAHYQAAIKQYNDFKLQFAQKYIQKSLREIDDLSFKDIQAYNNEKISYFRQDANLETLFIDYDNLLEERKSLASNALLIEDFNKLKTEIEQKKADGLAIKDINSYRAKLFRLSQLFDAEVMNEEYKVAIVALQEMINKEAIRPQNNDTLNMSHVSSKSNVDDIILKAVSLYELSPSDEQSLLRHLAGLYYLSIRDNARRANVNDLWKTKLMKVLENKNLRGFFKYNVTNGKEDDSKNIFVAIGGILFSFFGITLSKDLHRELLSGRIFLDKTDYQDPFKNIAKLMFNL